MRKTLSTTLLVASCLVLIFSIVFFVYGFIDINHTLNELANDPGASSIDSFGIGWGYGVTLFVCSVLGLLLSWISRKLLQQKALRSFSSAAMVVFAFLCIASIYLFYM